MAPIQLPKSVVVHPLVLLSVVDHYNRIAKDTNKRVVGVLLGSWTNNVLDVANSFAVPFEQDDKDPSVWFLDHNYLENMFLMFSKINAKEKIVGWYHTGPKLKQNDMEINEMMRQFVPNPILCIIDVKPKELGLPTDAYMAIEEIHDDGTPSSKTFEHVPSEIGAEEAEEIGVEHMLRDITDNAVGTLSSNIVNKVSSVRSLKARLEDIHEYLQGVVSGKFPVNNQILSYLQDIFNLLPNLKLDELVKAFSIKTNDQMLVLYLSSMIRSVIALHNLVNNKLTNMEAERKQEKGEDAKEEAKKNSDAKKERKDSKSEGKAGKDKDGDKMDLD